MKRFGSIIGVKPEKLTEYKELHANVWSEVARMIYDCNIRNYSIYCRDGYLFSYFEYIGDDYEADMARMAADPNTPKWWTFWSLANNGLKAALRVSGGLIWKRYFIKIELMGL